MISRPPAQVRVTVAGRAGGVRAARLLLAARADAGMQQAQPSPVPCCFQKRAPRTQQLPPATLRSRAASAAAACCHSSLSCCLTIKRGRGAASAASTPNPIPPVPSSLPPTLPLTRHARAREMCVRLVRGGGGALTRRARGRRRGSASRARPARAARGRRAARWCTPPLPLPLQNYT